MPPYGMGPTWENASDPVEEEPVSPLSPRSLAILAQDNSTPQVSPEQWPTAPYPITQGPTRLAGNAQRNSTPQVSPPQSPTAPNPIPQGPKRLAENYTLPPKFYVMPTRKPVGGGGPLHETEVSVHAPVVSSPNARESVQSRPRSQSVRPLSELVAMPTGFLQDFAQHAPANPVQHRVPTPPQEIPTGYLQDFTNHTFANPNLQNAQSAHQDAPARRSRSQTLPSQLIEAEIAAYKRRACSACGILQAKCRQDFLPCKKCTNMWYCRVECWDKRVCHSRPPAPAPEKQCAICGFEQSRAEHIFEDCGKCKDVGKAVFFCSDRCWDQRNCHVRATVQKSVAVPVPQPPRTYHPGHRSQQQRQEHLTNQFFPQSYGQHARDGRATERLQHDQVNPMVKATPETEKETSWVDSKACAISIWIIIPLIIFIIILGLVLGLKD